MGRGFDFKRFSDLLYMLTWRDIRVRYKQSVMGFLWAILTPGLVIGAGVFVRIGIARYSERTVTLDDLASVTVRAVAWTFFTSALRFGTNSLIGNVSLVTKIAFPREVFPLSATLSSLFDFGIASIALFAGLLLFGWVPTIHAFWALPLIITLIAFTTGLSLLLSAANLFFRDVKYLVEIILTYAIFLTPVLYDASFLGDSASLMMWNPLAPIMEGLGAALVNQTTPDLRSTGYSVVVSATLLLVGHWRFKRLEPRFAESI